MRFLGIPWGIHDSELRWINCISDSHDRLQPDKINSTTAAPTEATQCELALAIDSPNWGTVRGRRIRRRSSRDGLSVVVTCPSGTTADKIAAHLFYSLNSQLRRLRSSRRRRHGEARAAPDTWSMLQGQRTRGPGRGAGRRTEGIIGRM